MLLSPMKAGGSKLIWKPKADILITHHGKPAIIAGMAISPDNQYLATHAYNTLQLPNKHTQDHVLNLLSLQNPQSWTSTTCT